MNIKCLSWNIFFSFDFYFRNIYRLLFHFCSLSHLKKTKLVHLWLHHLHLSNLCQLRNLKSMILRKSKTCTYIMLGQSNFIFKVLIFLERYCTSIARRQLLHKSLNFLLFYSDCDMPLSYLTYFIENSPLSKISFCLHQVIEHLWVDAV